MQSNYSQNSRLEQTTELMGYLDEAHGLIKEEEWYNIPAPVRDTCTGIINFNERLIQCILTNAERAHKKVLNLEEKTKKIEQQMKGRFDLMDTSMKREQTKLKEMMTRQKEDNNKGNILMQEANIKLSRQMGQMDETMTTWSKKMKRINEQIEDVEELAYKLEKNGEDQTKEFEDFKKQIEQMFLIPGIIGPEKKTNAYTSVTDFIKETHEFMNETFGTLGKIVDSKIQTYKKAADKDMDSFKDDLGERFKSQEAEIALLRTKVVELDDELE